MSKSKAAKKAAAKARAAKQAELFQSQPHLWALEQGIQPGSIIWGIHPGIGQQYLQIKKHPALLLGFFEGSGILLPLSISKAKSGKFFGSALCPAEGMEISAPSWDCIILSPIRKAWLDSSKLGFSDCYQQRISELKGAMAAGLAEIWKGPFFDAKLEASLQAEAIKWGSIDSQGKPIHAAPGCKERLSASILEGLF